MMLDNSLIFQLLFLIILVSLNAFFALSEIAIISLNDNKIKKMASEGNVKAGLLNDLISEPSKFLATIQVGITISGLLASAFAAESFADRIYKFVISTKLPIDTTLLKLLSLVFITILLSYFTLVFGELVPKRIALQRPEQISMSIIVPLNFLSKISKPFVKFLSLSTNIIIKLFGINPDQGQEKITEEEIRMMMDVGQEKGVIQVSEKEMINNIFEFDNTLVSEIMTHRTDVVALSIDAELSEILDTASNEKYTRIPVYEDDIDNIVGILHIKDLLKLINQLDNLRFSLSSVIRQPYFIPSSKKTDKLFRELQKNKVHMAIVIDEYGGTAGIVTIEDLLEEIVGNIWDEYDEETLDIEKVDEDTYLVNGTIGLGDVASFFKIKLPEEEYDILSGFIIGQLGRIPDEEERISIEFNGYVFKVEVIEDKVIKKVKICRAL